ncbi:MAG TPA: hypothetical protein VH723_02385 [Candidatus Limnocylindrales bacterium]
MSLIRRVLALDDPQETRFWWFLSAFAFGIGLLYWFVSREPAGSVLLLAFGLATGVMAIVLSLQPVSRVVRERARGDRPGVRSATRDASGGGTADVERPFLDEEGRFPAPTTAPLAVGAGVALMALATIFGPAPAIVGVLPFAWGVSTWLSSARAELDVVEDIERIEAARVARSRGRR